MEKINQTLGADFVEQHVKGTSIFTDDVSIPGLLHAWPVLSPHAHALLLSLPATKSLEEFGTVTTLTADDVPSSGIPNCGPKVLDEPLFPSKVLYHSQPVAWVIGNSVESARRGANLVVPTYQELPAIVSIQQAIDLESFHTPQLEIKRGHIDLELQRAPHRICGQLNIGGQEHFYLETQVATAFIEDGNNIYIQSSTQHPSQVQEVVSRVLGISRNRITVECSRMGGAFGGKEVQATPWAVIAALGSFKTRKPVRVKLNRELDFRLTGKRHPFHANFEAGFDHSGKICALRIFLVSDGGWSVDLSDAVMWGAMLHVDNAYFVPNLAVYGRVAKTNKTSQTAFRGFGAPQGMLLMEDILDRIARTLKLRPDIVRQRNLYRDGDKTHYGQTIVDASRMHNVWNVLKERCNFDKLSDGIVRFNSVETHRKRGIAITPVKLGISFTASFLNQAAALVLMYRDGSVQVNHGGTEMGQGLNAKIREIAALCLGVSIESIRMMSTRTDKVPNTSPTAASASTDLNGAAVKDACMQLVRRLRPIAASLLECSQPRVTFKEGCATDGVRRVPIATLAEKAYQNRVPLLSNGYYRTPEIHFDFKTGTGKPFSYFTYGAAVSVVEVDAFTGEYRVLSSDLLQDVGRSLSSKIDLGQIEGGFIQGMGWLTTEELAWDEKGVLLSSCASTYKVPTLADIPPHFNASLCTSHSVSDSESSTKKAIGEPPLMLALSVREAIRDAITAFGDGRLVEIDSPATPERVFWAIQSVRKTEIDEVS